MEPRVVQPSESQEYYFQEGCYILECWNCADDPAVSIARARVAPGNTTLWHKLQGVTERYVVLQGDGEMEVGQQPPTPVTAGAVVVIPPDCRQRIRNTGEDDLIFLAVCSPRFTPAVYRSVDDDGR